MISDLLRQEKDDGYPQPWEGTGEELQRVLARFPHARFRLIPLLESTLELHQQGNRSDEETGSLVYLRNRANATQQNSPRT